ncbi:MAG: Type II secretion system protein E [Candidatus Omnitrophica bacterium]|nr:Type II secretion system protein E [Candidatus Omnitrophota bacterium]
MSTRQHLKLGEILLKEGLISQEQLVKALDLQKKGSSDAVGTILFKLGHITERELIESLSKQLNVPFVSRDKGLLKPAPDQSLEKLIPEELARKHLILPLTRTGQSLTVAFSDPTDVLLIDNLRKITGLHINRVIAMKGDLEHSIGEFYGEGGMLKSAIEASYLDREIVFAQDSEDKLSLDDIVASAEKGPVIKLTDLMIRQAIKQRASDIHIEPYPNKVTIRFRIDGVLQEIPPPDKSMLLPLISRLKILCKMDIAEKRLPQDGSFRAAIEGRTIDFRVSTIPTVHGEKMVIRILDRSAVSVDLGALGFDERELTLFRKAINRPHGMVLLTGPTGSGKTTTLYAALTDIKSPGINITTIEDPVEYQMVGINQVQVKPSIGLTFASGLRSFLRQDPDVMLVGETRDLETAQICVRAALTGHLVFSTLHTNDAPSAINRLIDIGIEPYFVTSSLLLVIAQRLVRRLCPNCKVPVDIARSKLPESLRDVKTIYGPKGCDACSRTGYSGRRAIIEVMTMNEEIEQLALRKASSTEIMAAAVRGGMVTLEHSGYKKVAIGETSLEEVLRVTMAGW